MTSAFLRRLPGLTFLLVGLFTLAFFVRTHTGLYDYDDHLYARYAHDLLHGTFHLGSAPDADDFGPHRERLLIFAPVAFFYRLFGLTIITTTLWPLLCTVGCAGLIWALYRRRAPVVAAAAMLLLGLYYFVLNLSTYLYPDNILMFWCLACAAALLKGRRVGGQWPVAWGIGFAGLNLAALLSKETIVYYLPFYVSLLGLDGWHRRHGRFWGAALAAGGALLGTYLGCYYALTGDALYRFHLIEQTNEALKGHTYALGRSDLLARITYQPLLLFIGAGLGLVLALAGQAARNRRRIGSDVSFWLGLSASALAFYWLGSTSLAYYNPNSLLPRMLTPLLPPLCLAAGFGLRDVVQTGRGTALLALVCLGGAGWEHNALSVVYGGMGLYFALLTLAVRRGWQRPGTAILTGTTLLALGTCTALRPIYFMLKPADQSFTNQHQLIRQHLSAPARGVVLVDDFLLRNYDFDYGFEVPAGLRYGSYQETQKLQLAPGERAWLLLNQSTLTNEELRRSLIRYSAADVLRHFPNRRLVAAAGPVMLFDVTPAVPVLRAAAQP